MPNMKRLLSALLFAAAGGVVAQVQQPNWQAYSPAAFDQASRQDRLILLDLVAVWCHWCHVMEATTYADSAVIEQIERHYVAIQADHDARPDLAERYRDYGWPATIILTADGRELVKRAGYIAPEEMAMLLQRTARGGREAARRPAETPGMAGSPVLGAALIETLERRHVAAYDPLQGGLALQQKFLDADAVEWDLHLARAGDAAAGSRARGFLDAALALIDPAFGGAYQYSTHSDWVHPHYEKIMSTQAAFLRAYSLAYRQFGDPRYRLAAEQVAAWLRDFMRAPNGGFYTSQDADLQQGSKAHDYFALDRAQRLQRGLPRIDRNQYADANGKAIEGLVTLYQVTGDKAHLGLAVGALDWVLRNRRAEQGGFRHAETDIAGPYLADSLYIGRALLAIHEASGQEVWLRQAGELADFIGVRFRHSGGGLAAAVDNGTPLQPLPQLDQNIHAARFLYTLASRTAEPRHLDLADHVMRYLATPEIATSRLTDAGILLADVARRQVASKQLLTLLPITAAMGGDA